MTAENTEHTTEATPTEATEVQEQSSSEQSEQAANPNAEAAKYRRKLRDTEESLTEIQSKVEVQEQRITSLQRKLIDQHTGAQLHDADDFWKFTETDLDELLDDDGLPDMEKVDEKLTALLEQRTYLKNLNVPKPDPSAGAKGTPAPRPTVEDFLQQRLG
jgi:predicted RNase H-like nuclease (RuvC/YqgF family)